jgi:hypothetical protein
MIISHDSTTDRRREQNTPPMEQCMFIRTKCLTKSNEEATGKESDTKWRKGYKRNVRQ